ncbi:MAG: hypothetical protein DMG05_23600, partial [Acidobacteria bacterium]
SVRGLGSADETKVALSTKIRENHKRNTNLLSSPIVANSTFLPAMDPRMASVSRPIICEKYHRALVQALTR